MWEGQLKATYTETFRLYLESFKTASFELKLGGESVIMNAFDVGNGDTGELPASSYFASVDLELVKDELYSIEITYAERIGQTKLVLYWESDSQVFAKVPTDYLFHTLNSVETPFTFTVEPAATNETMSHLVDTKPTENAIVNVQEAHIVNARDVFGNLQIHTSDVFTFTLTNIEDASIVYTGSSAPIESGVF